MKLSIFSLVLALCLSACSSMPNQVSLSPNVKHVEYQYDSQLRAAIQTTDERIDHYLISVQEKDKEVRQLIASGNNIRTLVQKEISDGFFQQGLNQVELSSTILKVSILKCHADVVQNSLSYEGKSQVHIKVIVATPKGEIAKLFKSEQKFENAFNVDLAKVQRNLNDQLGQAIEKVLADETIRKAINNTIKE